MIDERGHDDQATPPSGYDAPTGEPETVSWESPGSQETRESQAPPPPPTEADRVPTPWELQQEQGGQETVAADSPSPSGGAAVTHEPDSSRGAWEAAENRRAGELEGEAAKPSGDEDDEYRWHTDRTGRSESAESDAVEFI
ncbi:MAG TPA: hypothetical protein VF715_19240, partial [Thermoleophilaceae bacterium]